MHHPRVIFTDHMTSSLDRSTERAPLMVGELHLDQQYSKVISFDSPVRDITILQPIEQEESTVVKAVLRLTLSGEPHSMEPPTLRAKFKPFSSLDILNRPEEMETVLSNNEVIDVAGFPILVVIDQEQRKIFLTSLTKGILTHVSDRTQPILSEEATSKLEKEVGNMAIQGQENIALVMEALKRNKNKFLSLEEAHDFWIKVFESSLVESGVSKQRIDQMLRDTTLMWELHWKMYDTLHGHLCMSLSGEEKLWQRATNGYTHELNNPKGKVFETISARHAQQLQEMKKRDWLISDRKLAHIEQVGVEKAIPVTESDEFGERVEVFRDEESGIQIAVEFVSREYKTQGMYLVAGGKRNIKEPSFSKVRMFGSNLDFNDSWGLQTGEAQSVADVEYITVSPKEEVRVFKSGWVSNQENGYVLYKTPQGYRCVSIRFIRSENNFEKNTLNVQLRNVAIEKMADVIVEAQEKQKSVRLNAKVELAAAKQAHRNTTYTLRSPHYSQEFLKNLNVLRIISEEPYDPLAEGSFYNIVFDCLCGVENRQKAEELISKEDESQTNSEVFTESDKETLESMEKKFRKLIRCFLSTENQAEDQLSNYAVDNYLGLISSATNEKEKRTISEQLTDKVSQEFLFIAGLPSFEEQLAYVESKYKKKKRFLPGAHFDVKTWMSIITAINESKKLIENDSRSPRFLIQKGRQEVGENIEGEVLKQKQQLLEKLKALGIIIDAESSDGLPLQVLEQMVIIEEENRENERLKRLEE